MRPRIDILGFEALAPEEHFHKVSNRQFMNLLKESVWDDLSVDQHSLFEKLLSSERSRFIAMDDPRELLDDNHQSRYRSYKARVTEFSCKCVDALLKKHDVSADQVGLVVTNTTVQGICPPLSSVVIHHLGLPPSVRAVDLGFMGCSAAVLATELCSKLLRPGQIGLILSAELTSAMINLTRNSRSLPASCVFGDGVGAVLVAAPPHSYSSRFSVRDFSGSVVCSDDAMECISYEAAEIFHEIYLQDTIPKVAARGIDLALRPLVRSNLLNWGQKIKYLLRGEAPDWQRIVDYFILHVAGTKILESIQTKLSLTDTQVGHNFTAFRKYGNTSSTSIFYSLSELMRAKQLKRGDRLVFLAYGSGFMTQSMLATVN